MFRQQVAFRREQRERETLSARVVRSAQDVQHGNTGHGSATNVCGGSPFVYSLAERVSRRLVRSQSGSAGATCNIRRQSSKMPTQ